MLEKNFDKELFVNIMHSLSIFNIHRYSSQVQRLIIVMSALLIRFPLIFIFFGGTEMRNEIPIVKLIFAHTQGGLYLPYPYISLAAMLSWAAGVLNMYTSLPLGACYKLFALLFDLMLTVLVYDIFKRSKPEYAVSAGLLYAFAPIPLIINSIHFQFDSIVLFLLVLSFYVRDYFQDSLVKYFSFGLLFALSFLCKPYALFFLFFFFTPFKGFAHKLGHIWCVGKGFFSLISTAAISIYIIARMSDFSLGRCAVQIVGYLPVLAFWGIIAFVLLTALVLLMYLYSRSPADLRLYFSYQASAIIGMICTVAVVLGVLHFFGFNVLVGVDNLLRYANHEIPRFGLPFAYPFTIASWRILFEHRLWLFGIGSLISYIYYQEQIDSFTAILLSFMTIIGLTGFYAPYLQWPVVFFLLAGFFKLCAAYNVLITGFLLFFYYNPYANFSFPYESILSFSDFNSFAWLMPPHFLADQSFIPVLALLSNYIIPLFSVGVISYAIWYALQKPLIFLRRQKKHFSLVNRGYLIANIGLFLIIVVLWKLLDRGGFERVLNDITVQKMLWYHAYPVSYYSDIAAALFHRRLCSIIIFIYMFFWSIASWSIKWFKKSE